MDRKFRGRRIDNGEWAFGDYYTTNVSGLIHWIGENHRELTRMVDPSTVGQFTGLKDKNGKGIYEHDVIRWGDRLSVMHGTAINATIEYRGGCFGINDQNGNFHEFWHYQVDKWDDEPITVDMWGSLDVFKYMRACVEVIGNLHDNPELLEVPYDKD